MSSSWVSARKKAREINRRPLRTPGHPVGTPSLGSQDWSSEGGPGSGGNNANANANGGFFAIYDGHGGRNAVNFVSERLHEELAKSLAECRGEDVTLAIEQAFLRVDSAMGNNPKYQHCGSTACVAFVRTRPGGGGRELYVANCGDAQAVLAASKPHTDRPPNPNGLGLGSIASDRSGREQSYFPPSPTRVAGASGSGSGPRGQFDSNAIPTSSPLSSPTGGAFPGIPSVSANNPALNNAGPAPRGAHAKTDDAGALEAVALSYPHVATDAGEKARITRAGGQVCMGRVNGSLAVTRALGDHSFKRSGVTALPFQKKIQLGAEHKFLVIGCDGVWDVLQHQEAVQLVAGMKDPTAMARRIVDAAIERGSTDNVSAMVLRFND